MASQTFVIGAETVRKDICVRYLLGAVVLILLILAIFAGLYIFKGTETLSANGCKNPELDPYGMSNWTVGSDTVAFGCFPGHDLEGHHENLPVVSECINKEWVPSPPACAALPMRLDCSVEQGGISGTVQMWQESDSTPTFIFGIFNLSAIDRSKPQHSESITISRATCSPSTNINITMPPAAEPVGAEKSNLSVLEVRLNTTELKAYKKTTLRLDVIIVDTGKNITLPLVFVTQGDVTIMVKSQMSAVKIPLGDDGTSGNSGLIEGSSHETGVAIESSSSDNVGLIEGMTKKSSTFPPTVITYNESEAESAAEPEIDQGSEPLPEPSK